MFGPLRGRPWTTGELNTPSSVSSLETSRGLVPRRLPSSARELVRRGHRRPYAVAAGASRRAVRSTVLDDRVRAVLARLEEEDERETPRGLPSVRALARRRPRVGTAAVRARGAKRRLRGARDRRLAGLLHGLVGRGRPHPRRAGRIPRARLRARSRRGDATSPTPASRSGPSSSKATPGSPAALEEGFDLVFIDAWKDDYERTSRSRDRSSSRAPWSSRTTSRRTRLVAYVEARQTDPTLVSVTVPVGNGLEITTILR